MILPIFQMWRRRPNKASRPPESTASKAPLSSGFLDPPPPGAAPGQLPAQPRRWQKAARSRRAEWVQAHRVKEGQSPREGRARWAGHLCLSCPVIQDGGPGGATGQAYPCQAPQKRQGSCSGGGGWGEGEAGGGGGWGPCSGGKGLRSQGLAGAPALLSPATPSASVSSP